LLQEDFYFKALQVLTYFNKSFDDEGGKRLGKRQCPIIVGTVQLTNDKQSIGPILSFEPSPCFLVPLLLKLNSRSVKTKALSDFGASTYFIDKDFAEKYNLPLITKKSPVHVEVIDGRPLVSGDVTEKTKPLDAFIESHQSIIVFNVIKSPSNPVVLGLSWFDKYNPT